MGKEKPVTNVAEYVDRVNKVFKKNEEKVKDSKNNSSDYEPLFFRGEKEDYDDGTAPSLYRNTNLLFGTNKNVANYEEYYNEMMTNLGESHYTNNIELVEQLAKLQHYGAKTPLLDVTSNALAALYFASDKNNDKNGYVKVYKIPKNDKLRYETSHSVASKLAAFFLPNSFVGEFYDAIEKLTKQVKLLKYDEYFDLLLQDPNPYIRSNPNFLSLLKMFKRKSVDLSQFSNYFDYGWNLKKNEKAKKAYKILMYADIKSVLILFIDILKIKSHINNDDDSNLKYLYTIRDFLEQLTQKARTKEQLINPFAIYADLRRVQFLKSSRNNERIKNQQGLFILPPVVTSSNKGNGNIEEINKKGGKDPQKIAADCIKGCEYSHNQIPVNKDYKEEIKKELKRLGINEGSVYPDIENISKEIMKKYNDKK